MLRCCRQNLLQATPKRCLASSLNPVPFVQIGKDRHRQTRSVLRPFMQCSRHLHWRREKLSGQFSHWRQPCETAPFSSAGHSQNSLGSRGRVFTLKSRWSRRIADLETDPTKMAAVMNAASSGPPSGRGCCVLPVQMSPVFVEFVE